MKIIVTESQYQAINEYFNPIQYIQYLMDKELESGTDFESFQWMRAFQKYVDLIFKYAKKQTDMDNLSGMRVKSINREPWGTNFNDPNSKGMRLDWTLYLRPMLDGNVDHSEYKKMKEQYKVFKEVFSDTARQMGLTFIPAVEDKDVKDAKIDFKFDHINPQEFENFNGIIESKNIDNKKDDTAKWITCKNCNKKFTQTIHKGKKSLPVCPTCGTHNKDKKEEQNEGLHDTSWENEDGDKITLIDLLNATEDIPVKNISVEKLKPKLLTWDDDKEEVDKIEKSDLKYPILIFVDDNNKFISIIDGHHRAQKAVRNKLKTIKAKLIPINSLPKDMKKVFGHLGKQEQNESELTERCWKGYTQKGMKTMFGKRYPNCVKKKR